MHNMPPPSASEAPRSEKATILLVLGIISVICCPLAGPVAWYMGRQELNMIQAGAQQAIDVPPVAQPTAIGQQAAYETDILGVLDKFHEEVTCGRLAAGETNVRDARLPELLQHLAPLLRP